MTVSEGSRRGQRETDKGHLPRRHGQAAAKPRDGGGYAGPGPWPWMDLDFFPLCVRVCVCMRVRTCVCMRVRVMVLD
jgi:hypothetical protein